MKAVEGLIWSLGHQGTRISVVTVEQCQETYTHNLYVCIFMCRSEHVQCV